MLYFFMQSGQALCPKAIRALQKAHDAVLTEVSNKCNHARCFLNLACHIGAIKILGLFGVL
jgi:hypothetical protein